MNISPCLNPDCLHPNSLENKFCIRCGSKLLLGDRYRAISYIGEGGFGRTFKAIDEHRLNTFCVIKQFLPAYGGSAALEKATELFKQEALQLCALGKHPQIPDLLAFFEQQGRFYLVQEFIEGQDLSKELMHKGRFTEQKVRQFLLDLLPVLQFIHERNVIHRDIKLDNIIRAKDDKLVLIDFGVSKQLGANVTAKMGTIVGTPGYAPPEQMRGIVYPASDLYSLGVTAARLLTGCLPQEKNGSVIDEIYDPLNLRWLWRQWLEKNGLSVSSDLGNILDKMLQEKVNARFESAAQILALLNSQVPTITQLSFINVQDKSRQLPTHIRNVLVNFKKAYDSKNIRVLSTLFSDFYTGTLHSAQDKKSLMAYFERIFRILPWGLNPNLSVIVYEITQNDNEEFEGVLSFISNLKALFLTIGNIDSGRVSVKLRAEGAAKEWKIKEINEI